MAVFSCEIRPCLAQQQNNIYRITHRHQKAIFLHLFTDLFHNDISSLLRINSAVILRSEETPARK